MDQSRNPDSSPGSLLVEATKVQESDALGVGGGMRSQSVL